MKQFFFSLLLLATSFSALAQSENQDEGDFANNTFMPSIEVGYVFNLADNLSGGLLWKTSLEYRLRNNNDVFVRLNYDDADANFTLSEPGLTNVIEGSLSIKDLLLGGGYRFGDSKFRAFLLLQGGVRFYSYPVIEEAAPSVTISLDGRRLFTSRVTLGFEYYFSERSAFAVEVLQGNAWEKKDFWSERTTSAGFSVGFIATLF